ncbi:MAG: prepilin-type N-terminal cleavage/methylation domain-containing protein [Deltaproteobacteria bacterium]|nr:prepilin-type N-terminal cleavage/methylation domain-containing protein [Deltaproteobacteria bacterium]
MARSRPNRLEARPARFQDRPGFTMLELLVAVGLLVVIITVALTSINSDMPNTRLKDAARDVFNNIQSAKLGAIKDNSNYAVIFNTAGQSYSVVSGCHQDATGGTVLRTVNLTTTYKGNVAFGDSGHGPVTLTGPPPVPLAQLANLVFRPDGTVLQTGGVYLANIKNGAYAVIVPSLSGGASIFRWKGTAWASY